MGDSIIYLPDVFISQNTHKPLLSSTEVNSHPTFWCEACKRCLKRPAIAIQHLLGKDHLSKVQKGGKVAKPNQAADSKRKRKAEKEVGYANIPLKKLKKLSSATNATISQCKVCDVTLNSDTQAKQHFEGKIHLEAVESLKNLKHNAIGKGLTERGRGRGFGTDRGGRGRGFMSADGTGRGRGFMSADRGGHGSGFMSADLGGLVRQLISADMGSRGRGIMPADRGSRGRGFMSPGRGSRGRGFMSADRGSRGRGFASADRGGRGRGFGFGFSSRGGPWFDYGNSFGSGSMLPGSGPSNLSMPYGAQKSLDDLESEINDLKRQMSAFMRY